MYTFRNVFGYVSHHVAYSRCLLSDIPYYILVDITYL